MKQKWGVLVTYPVERRCKRGVLVTYPVEKVLVGERRRWAAFGLRERTRVHLHGGGICGRVYFSWSWRLG